MNRIVKSALLLLSVILLSSCFIDIGGGSFNTDDYLYVKGTAVRNRETGAYGFDSATIRFDYRDITDQLEPVNPKLLTGDIEENVVFKYPNYHSYETRYETCHDPYSKEPEGYEFDEWRILPLYHYLKDDMFYHEKETITREWQDTMAYLDGYVVIDGAQKRRRDCETLDDLPLKSLPYIMAEYNPKPVYLALIEEKNLPEGFTWEGDGTRENAYSLDEFRNIYGKAKEINVIVTATDKTGSYDLSDFLLELHNNDLYENLEEIHVDGKGQKNRTYIGNTLSRFDYVELIDITFDDIELLKYTDTYWKFTDCRYNKLTCYEDTHMRLEGCTGRSVVLPRK